MMMMMKVDVVVIQLASKLGIGKLWVKDESYRFNLKAFKVKAFLSYVGFVLFMILIFLQAVGSSYALARSLMGEDIWPVRQYHFCHHHHHHHHPGGHHSEPLSCILCSFDDVKARVKPSLLLVTATDGNHGFGVAYLAKLFGCKAKVMVILK